MNKEMKRKMLGLLVLCLLIPIASASSIELNPESFQVELVGGESNTQNFTVEWNGEAEVVGHLNYSVTEANGTYDGSELWINFSENPVILEPNQPKQLAFTINTIPNIYPDIYSIMINISAEIEEEIIYHRSRGRSYKYIDIPESTTVDNLTEETQQLIGVNTTQFEKEFLLGLIGKLSQESLNLTESLSILQDQIQVTERKANITMYSIILNILLIIGGIIIFLYKRLERLRKKDETRKYY